MSISWHVLPLLLLLLLCAGKAALGQTTTPAAVVIRVNVGGAAFTDPAGRAWAADAYFTQGIVSDNCPRSIAQTDNANLYCSYRWFNAVPPYLYEIPVPNGSYTVRLHFAELYAKTQ